MRVIFLGTLCTFSIAPLRILSEAGYEIGAVLIPAKGTVDIPPITPLYSANRAPIPLTAAETEPSLVTLAWEQQLPVYRVSRLGAPETLAVIERLQAEAACVACFPWRLPAALLRLPRRGCLNVHPSLLPHYRGPYPLFWMLRQGDRNFGVTIHFMDEHFDTGEIAAQAKVELPDGVTGPEADTMLSQYGGECLVEVLTALRVARLARHPQPPGGSYFPAPGAEDFVIDPRWSARHAFNFMRGTGEWGRPYPIELAGQRFRLKQALFYAADEVLGQPYRILGDQLDIQFSPGVLRALSV